MYIHNYIIIHPLLIHYCFHTCLPTYTYLHKHDLRVMRVIWGGALCFYCETKPNVPVHYAESAHIYMPLLLCHNGRI